MPYAGRLQIKEHRPWNCPLLVSLGILLIVLGMAGLYFWILQPSSVQQHYALQQLKQQYAVLQQKLRDVASQQQQLDATVTVSLRRALRDAYQQNFELQEKLAFYQSLATQLPDAKKNIDAAPEASIQSLRVKLRNAQHEYDFRLVLTQAVRDAKVLRGEVEIDIVGQLNDEQKRFGMQSLMADKTKLTYRLQHFQRIGGSFKLPNKFVPKQIIVYLLPEGGDGADEYTFYWRDVQQKEFM